MGYNWCELDLRKQLICCIRAGSDHSLSAMNSGTWGPKCRYNLYCWADNIVVTMGGGIANEDIHNNDDHEDLEVTGVNLGKTNHKLYA